MTRERDVRQQTYVKTARQRIKGIEHCGRHPVTWNASAGARKPECRIVHMDIEEKLDVYRITHIHRILHVIPSVLKQQSTPGVVAFLPDLDWGVKLRISVRFAGRPVAFLNATDPVKLFE
jgi:hypothetical protein